MHAELVLPYKPHKYMKTFIQLGTSNSNALRRIQHVSRTHSSQIPQGVPEVDAW